MPLPVIAIVLPLVLLTTMLAVLFAAYRRTAREIDILELPVHARCGSCGHEFELTMAELRRAHLTKFVSRTRTSLRGPGPVTRRLRVVVASQARALQKAAMRASPS